MSSKSIKFTGTKVYNLTYDNVDNWPNNPEMRTHNNISLIFSPNSDHTVSADTVASNNQVQYQIPYLTDFLNMEGGGVNTNIKTLFNIDEYINSISGGQFQDYTSTNETVMELYSYLYNCINVYDKNVISVSKDILKDNGYYIYSCKPLICDSDTLTLNFSSKFNNNLMKLYDLVLNDGTPVLGELQMEKISDNTYTITPNNRIILLLLVLLSKFPYLSEDISYMSDNTLDPASAVFSVFCPIGEYAKYFPELVTDSRFDRWITDRQLPMEDLYGVYRSNFECHQTHVGRIVDYINDVTNPSSMYITPYKYNRYRYTGSPHMTFYRLSDNDTKNDSYMAKSSNNTVKVLDSALDTIKYYYNKGYNYIILVDYG